ncbi:hypothetical protein CFOL_v3_08953, partial [Cephalotus follicularis]
LTDKPLRQVLAKPDTSGRLIKWSVELGEYDVKFEARPVIKSQVLADFVGDNTPTECMEEDPSESERKIWRLPVDGSSYITGNGSSYIPGLPGRRRPCFPGLPLLCIVGRPGLLGYGSGQLVQPSPRLGLPGRPPFCRPPRLLQGLLPPLCISPLHPGITQI